MEKLFSLFKVKNVTLKNRIVMPPLASFLVGADGNITDATIEHYRRRAAGGAAMVIVEACSVSPEGLVSQHQTRKEDRYVEGLAKIACAIKAEGTVSAVQIHHGGRQTSAKVIKRKPLAPPPRFPVPPFEGMWNR
jgi:2,4-dienoyl-CoA reductase-like NADH-dependent reductase (Old Yellow Enzyme family)